MRTWLFVFALLIDSISPFKRQVKPPAEEFLVASPPCGIVLTNTDIADKVIANVPGSTRDDCCTACLKNKACNAYTSWNDTCWLKSGSGGQHSAVGVTAGFVNKCSYLMTNVDYPGYDIKSVPSSNAATCCEFCRKTEDCNLFSWFQGQCYLKNGQSDPINKVGVISAVVLM
ncbi:hypothetical protein THRCLA_02205 [Thraustotheca clavata]|uniref:Secreted protein n=1 Tax=Thraustotheca clavata TaxID=74557 RepID=A0A0A7CM21_9STRA|nr:secreted protein [Thraustotheca clavata]OQS05691.1 hypothetical protein THRCLA_02205 [Thraustotheca clavata]